MELKLNQGIRYFGCHEAFNRTAYGIEILIRRLSHFRTLPF